MKPAEWDDNFDEQYEYLRAKCALMDVSLKMTGVDVPHDDKLIISLVWRDLDWTYSWVGEIRISNVVKWAWNPLVDLLLGEIVKARAKGEGFAHLNSDMKHVCYRVTGDKHVGRLSAFRNI